jgi:hypothetical protein
MKRRTLYLLLLLAFLTVASLALAQGGELALPWHRIAGGGSSADGARYALSGTIGQTEAGGLMEGSSFRLSGGYWGSPGARMPANDLYLPILLRPE